MLKIKLMRIGKKGEPHYRIVVDEAKAKNAGKYVEQLGYYNPRQNPSVIDLNGERVKYWLSQGAVPTDTVNYILVQEKIVEATPYKASQKDTKSSKKDAKKATTEKTKTEEVVTEPKVEKDVKESK